MAETFDVAVIGGGPGGYATALYGAASGLKIALIEADSLGGTCLNRGCIPTKELLQTAEVHRIVGAADDFGISPSEVTVDWQAAIARQGRVVDRLVKGLSGLLKKRQVAVVRGFGRLHSAGIVDVVTTSGDERVEADAVVLAAGSAPATIPGFDIDGTNVVTSDQALFLDELPTSCAIIGGGVIGVEFASLFADMGVEVILLEALDSLLYMADPELGRTLAGDLKKRGVDIRTSASVKGRSEADRSGMQTVAFEHHGEALEADVELVLVAVGRAPTTRDMNLVESGVALDDRGFVEVDTSNMGTTLGGVYAVGDCVDTPALAHVGYAEAMVAVRDILREEPRPVNYDGVPWCVYAHPEVAWCGLTEEQADARGRAVEVTKHNYAGVGRAVILGETKGFVKLVTDADTGVLVGVHIVGPWATEQLVEGYLSVNWEATAAELGFLVHPHPTLSEAMGEAALGSTGRGLHG